MLQAIDIVKESEDPMSSEFSRVLTEARLGLPLEESLEDMAERIDSDDFRWVVLAINIQREVGGNLAELMKPSPRRCASERRCGATSRALSAEGTPVRASSSWPCRSSCRLYMMLVNPEYVGTLLTRRPSAG